MARKHDILYVNFYTDGSAARKIAPAFPEMQPQRKPRAKKKKKTVIYFDPVAICSLMVAAVMLIIPVPWNSKLIHTHITANMYPLTNISISPTILVPVNVHTYKYMYMIHLYPFIC